VEVGQDDIADLENEIEEAIQEAAQSTEGVSDEAADR
jgi:hypothetical protein